MLLKINNSNYKKLSNKKENYKSKWVQKVVQKIAHIKMILKYKNLNNDYQSKEI